MDITCVSLEFSDILSLAQGVSERRATMPVLSHVLLSTEESRLKIVATDLETTIEAWCKSQIKSHGSIAVPSKKLFEIIREMPKGEINLKLIENNWIQITNEKASFKIAGLPATDYPAIPEQDLTGIKQIEAGLLDDMISKTIFAIASDDLRRNLAGIYIEPCENNTLRIIGTDGHRLSYVQNQFENNHLMEKGIIVPRKGVVELKKLLRGADKVGIKVFNNFLVAAFDDCNLYIRLIEQDYPDYKQVIPKESKISLILDREDFLTALKRVAVFSSEKTKSIKLILDESKLDLIAITPEVGEATEQIAVDYNGDKLELGFNSTYIMDVIDAISEKKVLIKVTDELSPALIRPQENEDYISVIMPMRV